MVLKVDSVIIATPNHTHFDVFKEINCIKKIPILCEKPLTIDNDQASIFEKEAHHLSIVGFNYRHNPVISFLVEYIKNNDLGQIMSMNISFNKDSAWEKKHIVER